MPETSPATSPGTSTTTSPGTSPGTSAGTSTGTSPGALPFTDWIEPALRITGHFEDSQDPLAAVTGDFDGMGISLGVLQWNIGQGSLQPLVRPLGRAGVIGLMPHYGIDLWNACTTTISNGLQIVRGWQNGSHLAAAVTAELKNFCRSPAFLAQQKAAASQVAKTAYTAARDYAAADPTYGQVTRPLFCWFFDVMTQNGGLKGLTYQNVKDFIDSSHPGAVEAICDWLAARTAQDAGYRDSHKNAVLWRSLVSDQQRTLFVLSYLRALKANTTYRADTLNRKATIVLGKGYVHLELHDLTGIL